MKLKFNNRVIGIAKTMDKKIIVDLGDDIDIYARVKIKANDLHKLKKLVKKIQRKEDYHIYDLKLAIKKEKLKVNFIPLESDKFIYF